MLPSAAAGEDGIPNRKSLKWEESDLELVFWKAEVRHGGPDTGTDTHLTFCCLILVAAPSAVVQRTRACAGTAGYRIIWRNQNEAQNLREESGQSSLNSRA